MFRKNGQATAEMAIMGTVIMMLLAYLLQQGFFYNARQALEMYTFRQALQTSKYGIRSGRPVGISLTVIRDVIIPSFFSGISRQRLMSSASVDFNPWIVYDSTEPGHMSNRQLLQVGERMIRRGEFLEVPPSYVSITTNEDTFNQWTMSAIRDLSASGYKLTEYDYRTNLVETPSDKTITKDLISVDTNPIGIQYETAEDVASNYLEDDWTTPGDDDHILAISASNIPSDVTLNLQETVNKVKTITTPH